MRLPTREQIARMRVVPQIQPEEEEDFKSEILEWTPDPEVYSMPYVRGYIHETKLEDSDEVEDVPSRCTSVASSASMPSPLSIADMRLGPVSCSVPNAYGPQCQVHVFDETNALSFVSSGSPPQLYPYIGYHGAPLEPGLSDSFSGVSGGPYYEQQDFGPYVTLDGYLSPMSASTSSASSPSPSSTPHLSLDYVSSQISETASLDFTSYDYPALPADWSQQTLQFPYVVDSYNDF
ncbi:hypothetical protein PHLCEN_2v4653 [Hermanssonia centrifuga]|uniref:Uncharacterized protein n=1 Tax=Hermanssonia centrifuga TaxID=98765 RepID=A0A2R6PMW5_9APHY|nr:hypothetical protein PHLCEN_2v4653 [Hermanssonia centrifuga]